MKLAEFKAWFDGYTEDMDGPPSAKQWKRIKKAVKDIDGQSITERIFLDRYWPRPYRHLYEPYFTCAGTAIEPVWNGTTPTAAMYAAGKSEAGTLTIQGSTS